MPVTVTVRFFAAVRERTGISSLALTFDRDPSVREAWDVLQQRYPALEAFADCVTFAVNREYVDHFHTLSDGDELALIPPVSGGCNRELP